MPKYLVQASYTPAGTKGILSEGGTHRRAAVEKLAKKMGGRLEAFYFTFGDQDVVAIFDYPDNVTAASLSMVVNASGFVALKTTPLLSAQEIDEAVKKNVPYVPPGK